MSNEKKKPSELPKYAVIEDEENGPWIKGENQWYEINSHCVDCMDQVYDDVTLAPKWSIPHVSDEYFKDFKILAMPV